MREGQTEGGLPYLSFGEGPPLVVFPGLGMTNANPSGIQRRGEMPLLAPLARVFTVHRISRRVGLASGTTMEDLANDYAVALDEEFGEPVNVLGISTGGFLAMQLAADRPELVSRLVVAGAACRLSEHGRRFQRRTATFSRAPTGPRRYGRSKPRPAGRDSDTDQRLTAGLRKGRSCLRPALVRL